jgi:hypothetical protein
MLCFVHHHASWHTFYHVKHRIICIRVVHTRVRRFVLNKCWRGWCWSSFGEDDSPVVLVSNLTSTRTNFSATKASPGAFKPFLEFYKSLSFILWFTTLSIRSWMITQLLHYHPWLLWYHPWYLFYWKNV